MATITHGLMIGFGEKIVLHLLMGMFTQLIRVYIRYEAGMARLKIQFIRLAY